MKKTVEEILNEFKNNQFSIISYFERFGVLAQTQDLTAAKDRINYIMQCLKDSGIDTSIPKEEQNISQDELFAFADKVIKTPKLSEQNYEILSRSSFLMLNNYFEYLLTDLLTYYYNKFKESLNDKDFKLSLKELSEYETIEDATKSLILKEVESMVIELTFPKLLDHFKSKLNVSLEEDIINWEKIEEFRERRHLIVHNSSIVNKKYLIRTKNPYNLKLGDKIDISHDYFKLVYEEFYLAGLILSYNCWGNWDKENADSAISDILMETFEKTKEGKFDFTRRLTDYAHKISPRNDIQEDCLLRVKFNRCIALKRLGHKKELAGMLKSIKVVTALPLFQLAHSILSEKEDNIIDLVNKTKALDDIDHERYEEWPIYSFVRENEKLNSEILEILK
ncbi:MAG: hypothetical protein ACO1O1_13215 [Adhaeribacter sp.]